MNALDDGAPPLRVGGHELAARLRESRPGLKVMFMSGFAEGGDFSAAALPPATAFLEKPFTFTHLTERIRELASAAEISIP